MNDAQRELISAHFDGELDQEHRAEVERLLADDPTCRRWWDEMAGMRDTLRGLPAMSAGDDLADRVLRSAERAMFTNGERDDADQGGTYTTEGAMPRHIAAARGDIATEASVRSGWVAGRRSFVWSVAAIAAVLFVFVSISRNPDDMIALAPNSDSRLKESEPTRPSEPTDRGDGADTSTAEPESLDRSRRESVSGKAAPANDDTLSSEPVPSDMPAARSESATAVPPVMRAGKAGAGDMPRSAKGGAAGVSAKSGIENGRHGGKYGAGGYGGADYGNGGFGDGGYGGAGGYGGGGYGNVTPADERELKERFVDAAANRTVYVVHVDVPTDAEGVEQLNVLLAKQQIMTAPTDATAVEQQAAARELKLSESLASVSFDEPRYYYAEMTPGQLQAAVVDMRSQREVFSNVALSDTALNQIKVESLASDDVNVVAKSRTTLESRGDADTDGERDDLSDAPIDRLEAAAGRFAARQSAPAVQSLYEREPDYQTSELLPPDQGAVVDLGQRASSRKYPDGLGRQLSRPASEEGVDEIIVDDEGFGFFENDAVGAPVADPVVQQVITEGQQALSEWRFQNVIVGQQAMPAARVPALNAPATPGANAAVTDASAPDASASGDAAAVANDRARPGSTDDKRGNKAEDDVERDDVTDAPAAPSQAFGAMRQRRMGGQAPRRSSLSQSQQAAGSMFGAQALQGAQARQQDAGLVGTLFILRQTDQPSTDLRSSEELSVDEVADESTSDRPGENDDDSETTGEPDKSDAAEPAGAGDE